MDLSSSLNSWEIPVIDWESMRATNSIVNQQLLEVASLLNTQNRLVSHDLAKAKTDEFQYNGSSEMVTKFFGSFHERVLRECMIYGILDLQDFVFFSTAELNLSRVPTGDFIATKTQFQWLLWYYSELKDAIYRAASFVWQQKIWQEQWYHIPTRILTFNDEFDPITQNIQKWDLVNSGTPYLDRVPEKERLQTFRLWTLSHEIGHHIYMFLPIDQKEKWWNLVDKSKPLSKYTEQYSWGSKFEEESFSEGVRLFITAPSYLKEVSHNWMKIYNFMKDLKFAKTEF